VSDRIRFAESFLLNAYFGYWYLFAFMLF